MMHGIICMTIRAKDLELKVKLLVLEPESFEIHETKSNWVAFIFRYFSKDLI